MGTLPFAALQTRPTEVLDLTRLTVDEFRRSRPDLSAQPTAWPVGYSTEAIGTLCLKL